MNISSKSIIINIYKITEIRWFWEKLNVVHEARVILCEVLFLSATCTRLFRDVY